MPKLYGYFGLMILFYANEHEPVHVHGKSQGRESRAEITVINGVVINVSINAVIGRPPLNHQEMHYFEELVTARADILLISGLSSLY